jgi:hypothetical protein
MSGLQSIDLGYDSLEFSDLVDRELKGTLVNSNERGYLEQHKIQWRATLIDYKKRTEMQFTSSAARRFTLYQEHLKGKLTEAQYIEKIGQENVWRCNAARFLQQVEARLQWFKYAPA